MPLQPSHINFLALFESVHGQPDYVSRSLLVQFVEKHKGAKGPLGYTIRWPAWMTYNQDPARPYKSLRRGNFRVTEAWAEYNKWKSQNSASLHFNSRLTEGEEADHKSPTDDCVSQGRQPKTGG